jgi:hypothetical protein
VPYLFPAARALPRPVRFAARRPPHTPPANARQPPSDRFKLRNLKRTCWWTDAVTLAEGDAFECTEMSVVIAKGVVAGVAASSPSHGGAGEVEELKKMVRRLSQTNEELLASLREAPAAEKEGGARQRPAAGSARARSKARK